MKSILAGLLAVATLSSAQTLNIPARNGPIRSESSPITLRGFNDMKNQEFDRGRPCDSDEDTSNANAVFILENGATLANAIIGANHFEGVHCLASCTLRNVWFRDVCEDAIFALGNGNVLIEGGGAANGKNKLV